ncbi:SURF1 family protein [soil metagenome]
MRGHGAPARRAARIAFAAGALLAFLGFVALGTWQLERRVWKLALIERVAQRVHAPAVSAPGPERWAEVTAASDEYRHVQVAGVFTADATAFVQAVTELGPGFWVLAPLRLGDGSVVMINRGFVTEAQRKTLTPPSTTHPVEVTGLLRISEPGGGFLRHNDATADRWFSRDVAAIASARGLRKVAPYFIDAEAAGSAGGTPAAAATAESIFGLTVIAFHNNHLVYAITWYTLAAMVAAGLVYARRRTVS